MKRCAVFGASGGIGAALVRQLAARDDVAVVYAGGRSGTLPDGPKIHPFRFDATDDDELAAVVAAIGAPLDVVIVATGRLTRADGSGPEKALRQVTAAALAEQFADNAIVPAMIARAVLPLLARDRPAVFAALSARVGSIGDNRLGGWHAYRASKAALNMLIRTIAIEAARKLPLSVVVALHPGTVATPLSAAFQRGVAQDKLFTPDMSAAALLGVIDGLTPADTGGFFAWDGAPIPF
ncbi:SDR family NAD(P)-dependent oxidoreductase [Novosphingobium sp.]|uniref:SDR family NAD(P)-dependent oxidoreductase n=1 Tax=Novosphingobium sp. TaxID=1874826 RepID=UPI0033420333